MNNKRKPFFRRQSGPETAVKCAAAVSAVLLLLCGFSGAGVVYAEEVLQYDVKISMTGLEGRKKAKAEHDYWFFEADRNYDYTVRALCGGEEVEVTDFGDGDYMIPAEQVIGNISISGSRKAHEYPVTVYGPEGLKVSAKDTAVYGKDYRISWKTQEGVAVTAAAQTQSRHIEPVLADIGTSTVYLIPGAEITGPLTVTVTAHGELPVSTGPDRNGTGKTVSSDNADLRKNSDYRKTATPVQPEEEGKEIPKPDAPVAVRSEEIHGQESSGETENILNQTEATEEKKRKKSRSGLISAGFERETAPESRHGFGFLVPAVIGCLLTAAAILIIRRRGQVTVVFDTRSDSDRGFDTEDAEDTEDEEGVLSGIQRVPAGTFLEEPALPRKKGKRFTGWYKDEACTRRWDFYEDTADSDLTLYAGWR